MQHSIINYSHDVMILYFIYLFFNFYFIFKLYNIVL